MPPTPPIDGVNQIELARWQGGVDERIDEGKRRLDILNGDIRDIKLMIGSIRDENRVFAAEAVDRRRKDRIALIAAIMPLAAGLVTAITLLINHG